MGLSAHVHEPPPMAQSKRAKLIKRIRIVLLVGAFACSVLLLVILGSVCIAQRNYGSDVECTLCGSCSGAIAMGVFGCIAAVTPPIAFCAAIASCMLAH